MQGTKRCVRLKFQAKVDPRYRIEVSMISRIVISSGYLQSSNSSPGPGFEVMRFAAQRSSNTPARSLGDIWILQPISMQIWMACSRSSHACNRFVMLIPLMVTTPELARIPREFNDINS